VTDRGSHWTNTFLTVGRSGAGSFTVRNGAIVDTTGAAYIGTSTGAGTVTVSGAGSEWNLAVLEVGAGATSATSLSVQGGSVVNSGVTSLGFSSAATAAFGETSRFFTSTLCVGCAGSATLNMNSGAIGTSTAGLTIGLSRGVTGTMTVTGSGTSWINSSGAVLIGQQGTGTLNVENGALFSTSGDLVLANSGTGTLALSGGGELKDVNATIGAVSGSNGVATVSGAGSQWTSSGSLEIGVSGSGELTVQDHGTVKASDITIGKHGMVDAKGGTLHGKVVNHGTLDPLGAINLIGNYTQASDGTLLLDVAGTSTDLQGTLDVSGSSLFQGNVAIDFIDGFAPKKGDKFELIMSSGGADFKDANFVIEGLEAGFKWTDTVVNGDFTLTALNNGVSTSGTPEPGTLALTASAVLAALTAAVFRRRLYSNPFRKEAVD
ncbi:MAG: hypothetical protein WB992_17585, partial [Bryobacteraceae bacterium]